MDLEPLDWNKVNPLRLATWLAEQGRALEQEWIQQKRPPEQLAHFYELLLRLTKLSEETWHTVAKPVQRLGMPQDAKQLSDLIVPLERIVGKGLYDHEFCITQKDSFEAKTSSAPLRFILHNIRSAFNVGAMLRTAECLGAEKVYLTGYTPSIEGGVKKTAMGMEQYLSCESHVDVLQVIQSLQALGFTVIALETSQSASLVHEYSFPTPCAIIVGNEQHGIEAQVIKAADACVRIPVFGHKNSLNVGIAMSVCGYEIRRQWDKT